MTRVASAQYAGSSWVEKWLMSEKYVWAPPLESADLKISTPEGEESETEGGGRTRRWKECAGGGGARGAAEGGDDGPVFCFLQQLSDEDEDDNVALEGLWDMRYDWGARG